MEKMEQDKKKNYPGNPSHPVNPGSLTIVRTDRLGDIVLTLPMASAIKRSLPTAHVSFLVRNYTAPIVERCPHVDEVRVVSDKPTLGELMRAMRGTKAAFLPSPRFIQALAAFLARVPKRIGTGYRWYSFLFTDKIYEHRKTAEHQEAEYNLRMLKSIGIEAELNTPASIELRDREKVSVQKWIEVNIGSEPFAVLHIGSGGSTQNWSRENFIEVGQYLVQSMSLKVVLTGTTQESAIIQSTARAIATDSAIPFIGHSLPDLAALLQKASIVLSGSTGPGHLAAALGAPTIGLFPLPRPLSKERWGFRGARAMSLSPDPLPNCPNCAECTCMERIAPETVERAIGNFSNIIALNSSNI